MHPSKFWTDARLAHLRELWEADELSASEIERIMGCTGNAVVGKACRLLLRSRRPEGPWGRRKRGDVPPTGDSLARYGSATRFLTEWQDDGSGVMLRVLVS